MKVDMIIMKIVDITKQKSHFYTWEEIGTNFSY